MGKNSKKSEQEFLEHLNRNQAFIHKICLVYAGASNSREDLFQEITLQLWKSYPSFKGDSAFSTWGYRVALNTALGLTRRPSIFTLSEHTPEGSYDAESEMELDEQVRLLYKAIAKLKKVDRAIVLLWLEDSTYEEIADTCGITVKNVSVRLVRLKAELARIIKSLQ